MKEENREGEKSGDKGNKDREGRRNGDREVDRHRDRDGGRKVERNRDREKKILITQARSPCSHSFSVKIFLYSCV